MMGDGKHVQWGASMSGNAFAVHPRLTVLSEGDGLCPELDRATTAMQISVTQQPLASLTDPTVPLSADMLWVTLTDDPGVEMLASIAERADDAAVALILHVSGKAIDPVWAMFGDRDGTTITINPDEIECAAALGQALRFYRPHVADSVSDQREQQMNRLQDEVQRISRLLSQLAVGEQGSRGSGMFYSPDGSREVPSPFIEDHVRTPERGFSAAPTGAPISARDVRRLIRRRRLRDELFPAELFADPAWDMLLDLYAAKLDRSRVSVSSLCIAAAVPATTALRWIKTLSETGIFVREADHQDGRRIFVALSDQATEAMHRYFARLAEI